MTLKSVLSLTALALGAFGMDDHEHIVVGKTFMAGGLDSRSGSTGWALTSHGIAENLFTVDKHGEIVPQVAASTTKVSALVWDVALKPDYHFSDGAEVDAAHVAACLNELNEVNDAATSSLGAFTATAEDALTVRITSERETHIMDSVLAEWVFAIYHVGADGALVYTGPYAPAEFVAGSHIELVPNAYYDAHAGDRPDITLRNYDGDALAAALNAGEVDVAFHLPVDTLGSVRSADGVHAKSFEVNYHYMMWHNMAKLEPAVREAIDVAVDRDAVAQSLSGGVGTRSLFPDFSPFYNPSGSSMGNADEAAALLDAAGYALVDGVRTKDGAPLSIDLVAYNFRPDLRTMQTPICESLSAVGIVCNAINTMDGDRDETDDWSEVTARLDEGDFDLLLWAQNTLPSGDSLSFLSGFFRTGAGNNMAGLASTEVDSLLDALGVAEGHENRVAATTAVHEAIMAERPVSNLVTPAWHVGVSDRMIDYEPWGSDYYVIRSDLLVHHDDEEHADGDHDGHHGDEHEEHDDHDGHDHGDNTVMDEESDGAASAGVAALAAALAGAAMFA